MLVFESAVENHVSEEQLVDQIPPKEKNSGGPSVSLAVRWFSHTGARHGAPFLIQEEWSDVLRTIELGTGSVLSGGSCRVPHSSINK